MDISKRAGLWCAWKCEAVGIKSPALN